MIIYKKNNIKNTKITSINKFYKYYFFLSISLFFLLILLILQTGFWGNYKKTFLDRLYKSSYNNYLKIPYVIPQAIYGFFIKIPEININISFDNQLILERDRKNVMEQSSQATTPALSHVFTKVPASINFEKKNYNVDLRLKGDRTIHFVDHDKISYKIEIDKDKTIFGLNKFSLIKPRARNYIHEWLYHEFMKEGGLINLKYEFVKLKINGEGQGLYVVEEGFDKILIERNKRRNGPIFSVNEEWMVKLNNNTDKEILFEVYNKKNWLSQENIQLTLLANNLLKNFFNGKEDMSNLFDVDKWAWFMAASDINYYSHGTKVNAVKFYFNPLKSKFEPVPFDGHRIAVDFNKDIINWENLRNSRPSFESALSCSEDLKNCADLFNYKFFFKKDGNLNKVFFNKYKKYINIISSKKFLDNFFKKRSKQIFRINAKIYSDYFYADNMHYYGPGLYYFNKDEIYKRGNRLELRISNIPTNIIITQSGNRIYIKNWNITNDTLFSNRNLIVKKIFCKDVLMDKEKIYDVNIIIDKIDQNIIFEENIKDKLKCNSILLTDQIYNTNFIKKIDHLNFKYQNQIDISSGNFLDYFYVDNVNLRLKKNQSIIDKNIIIPKGYIVKIIPGEEIILTNNSFIISDSPFNVDGGDASKNPPIKIGGKNNNKGGGIFIKNTNNENYFQNVFFENLSGDLNNVSLNKYIIYGAINIYNSEVKFKNFHIKNINSEDAINLISSNFLLENGSFDEISSDAIDVDYGKGSVRNLKIHNVLNDAIDFSESYTNVSNIYFENIGDKAISAGENSEIDIDNLKILKSYVGIASKDGSRVNGKNIKISNVSIPLASYNKKNEYEIAELIVKKINYHEYKKLYLKDKFSKITIDNKIKKKITNNILDIIYDSRHKIY